MLSPSTLAAPLPPDLAAILDGLVSSGRFPDAAAALRAALERLHDDPGPEATHQAFRLTLEERLRGLLDPLEATSLAARMLGTHLGAARAGYGEIDEEAGTVRVERDWTDGRVMTLAGEARLLDGFGPAAIAELRAGRVLAVEDCLEDPRAGPDYAPTWASIGARSLVVAPLVKDGRLRAILYVHEPSPRRWTPAEAALVRDVAERTWDLAARARAEAALRESEARHRTLFDAAPFAVIVIDPQTHRVLDVNEHACAAYGYTPEEFLRLSITDIDARGDSAAIRAHARAHALRPGLQEFEARHRTKSGAVRDVLVRVQGVQLGGREVSYGAHLDITDRKAEQAALRASDARLRLAVEAARLGTWEFDLRRGVGFRAGPLAQALRPVADSGFTLDAWFHPLHPEDRPEVERRFHATARGEAPRFEAEFRVRDPARGWVWISSFGAVVERDPATGAALRIGGVAQDVTARKTAEERQALLMREVDHRAKNALAVVQAALRLTRAGNVDEFRRMVEGRVSALARAQTLLAEDRWSGTDLRTLLQGEMAPFLGGAEQRAELDGPPVSLPAAAAQPLAMAVHELATNAVKHGALAAPTGRVNIAWALQPGPSLRLRWVEAGGPPVPRPPERRGFGSRVLEGTVRGQLGGSITLSWERTGLVCEVAIPLAERRRAPA
ncbi:PAS domain S-box protein [Muricoccus radiodurans]|uniref:PAS domain S-box protein n=1 Tax=Muricoccus radiodurans TaxID=2231721 RepID=UPI003CE72EB3